MHTLNLPCLHSTTSLFFHSFFYAGGHGLSGSPLSTVEVFDSRTFRWTQGRKLDHGFYYAAGLPTHGNSKLLVVGGNSGNGDSYRRDIIEYDPESDAWIRVGQLEQSRAYSVAIPLSRAWCDDGL